MSLVSDQRPPDKLQFYFRFNCVSLPLSRVKYSFTSYLYNKTNQIDIQGFITLFGLL